MTTNKQGYCVCGKKLIECRGACCASTLYALSGEWVERWVTLSGSNCFSRKRVFSDGSQGSSAVFDLRDPDHLLKMLIAVGGAYQWMLPDSQQWKTVNRDGRRSVGETMGEAVIKEYVHMVDWRL